MYLHKKQLGNLGELKVAFDLTRQGYSVFKEFGDNCKSDLLVMDEAYVPLKVQVKALTSKDGKITIKSSKSGPNYYFDYEYKHADIFAVYVLDRDLLLYISNTKLLSQGALTVRIDEPKNKQHNKVNFLSTYTDFKRALRDCTRNILIDLSKDDGTVQPTTEMVNES